MDIVCKSEVTKSAVQLNTVIAMKCSIRAELSYSMTERSQSTARLDRLPNGMYVLVPRFCFCGNN